MLARRLIAVLCAVTVCSCANVSLASAAPRLALVPCDVAQASERVRCGTLIVPEDRSKAAGRMISLNVVVVPSGGKRTVISLRDMAPDLVKATLAAEDARFYEHPGFDPGATLRSAWVDVTRQGSSGASARVHAALRQSLTSRCVVCAAVFPD